MCDVLSRHVPSLHVVVPMVSSFRNHNVCCCVWVERYVCPGLSSLTAAIKSSPSRSMALPRHTYHGMYVICKCLCRRWEYRPNRFRRRGKGGAVCAIASASSVILGVVVDSAHSAQWTLVRLLTRGFCACLFRFCADIDPHRLRCDCPDCIVFRLAGKNNGRRAPNCLMRNMWV